MHADSMLVGHPADFLYPFHRIDGASCPVVRILQAYQTCGRKMDVGGPNGCFDLGRREDAPIARYGTQLNARQECRSSRFVVENMGLGFQNDLFSRLGMGVDGHLIPHRSRSHEKTGLLAQHRCDLLLKAIHRRVFAKDIIPHLGRCHGLPHRSRRLGKRIATQIDYHREIPLMTNKK